MIHYVHALTALRVVVLILKLRHGHRTNLVDQAAVAEALSVLGVDDSATSWRLVRSLIAGEVVTDLTQVDIVALGCLTVCRATVVPSLITDMNIQDEILIIVVLDLYVLVVVHLRLLLVGDRIQATTLWIYLADIDTSDIGTELPTNSHHDVVSP